MGLARKLRDLLGRRSKKRDILDAVIDILKEV